MGVSIVDRRRAALMRLRVHLTWIAAPMGVSIVDRRWAALMRLRACLAQFVV